MATTLSKSSVPTSTPMPLHYVPRNGQIVKLSWSELTEQERESQRQADERAYQVVLFNIYGQEAR